MTDHGRRRQRRPALAILSAMLIAGLTLPAVAGLVAAAEPSDRADRDVVATFGPASSFGTAAVAPGTVGVKSSVGYQYGDGSTAVVGEILNLRTLRTRNVTVSVTYFRAAQGIEPGPVELGTASDIVLLAQTSRGGDGPFVVLFTPEIDPASVPPVPYAVSEYLIEVDGGAATTAVVGGVLDIVEGPQVVVTNLRYYEGTITNPNAFSVSAPSAMLTVYDAAGDVLEVFDHDLLPDPVVPGESPPMLPGESRTYSIGVDTDLDATTASSTVLAEGDRTDRPTVYITSWANYFDDLPLETFRRDIIWLAEQRITGGCGNGKYCPLRDVRRDEMASFLARAIGLTEPAPNAFSDDNGNTHEANINRIAQAGITGGCGVRKYCPASKVKRDQMASFLARAVGLTGAAPNAFSDDNGNTHEANINRIAQAGITGGCGVRKYCPSVNVTRGQMAAFLRRAFEE